MKQIAAAILSMRSYSAFSFGKVIPPALIRSAFILSVIFLFLAEIFRVYLVMPFPGSQRFDTVDIAHWISMHIVWIRIIGFAILSIAMVRIYKIGLKWEKTILGLVVMGYIFVLLLFNYKLDAENVFHQPDNKSLSAIATHPEKKRLVIGVVINGEAKAYPIQLIGYHHQVVDTVGNEPVMITYCTVCRTGRVYSTIVNGQHETFRLVGMDHFNAVFEDKSSKSWWQQASGIAIAGPLKGSSLKEIPSHQLTIEAWRRQYPNSMIMDPDSAYEERYFGLEDYDKGTMRSPLVKRNHQSWQAKSWIVGVKNEHLAMAYDWSELVQKRIIQDSLPDLPIVLTIESDTTSFHVFDRRVNGTILKFVRPDAENLLTDINTHSTWNMDGLCIGGTLSGKQLTRVQAYNEFWHSWERFQYNPKKFVAVQ